jgi:hypothetical protein
MRFRTVPPRGAFDAFRAGRGWERGGGEVRGVDERRAGKLNLGRDGVGEWRSRRGVKGRVGGEPGGGWEGDGGLVRFSCCWKVAAV